MSDYFKDIKVDDRVWSSSYGWGTLSSIADNTEYPLVIYFEYGEYEFYTRDGRVHIDSKVQSLFWDEIKLKAPPKPKQKKVITFKAAAFLKGENIENLKI